MRSRIFLIDLIALVVLVLLLQGRPPLSENVHLIKLKMSLDQVRAILGSETTFSPTEYEEIRRTDNFRMDIEDDFLKVDAIHYEQRPAYFPSKGVVLYHKGLDKYSFTVPMKDLKWRYVRTGRVLYWFDRTHSLWLLTDESGRAFKWALVPLTIERAEFFDRCEYLWMRLKQFVWR